VSARVLLSLRARVGAPLLLCAGDRRAVAVARIALDAPDDVARVGWDVWASLGARAETGAAVSVRALEGVPPRAESLEWSAQPLRELVRERGALADVDSLARAAARAAAAAPAPALVAALLHGRVFAAGQIVALPLLGGDGGACVRIRAGAGAGAGADIDAGAGAHAGAHAGAVFSVDASAPAARVDEWVRAGGDSPAPWPTRAALAAMLDAALPGARGAAADLIAAATRRDGSLRAGGVLVTGPPGVGKRALVRALLAAVAAAAADGAVAAFRVAPASLSRGASAAGDAESRVRDLGRALAAARARGAALALVLDDAHDLLPARPPHAEAARVRGALLDLLDAWTPQVTVFALSPHPAALAAAALAPSRLPRAVALPPPTAAERAAQAAAVAARAGVDGASVARAAADALGASRADVDALVSAAVLRAGAREGGGPCISGGARENGGAWEKGGAREGGAQRGGDDGAGGGVLSAVPPGPALHAVARGARAATLAAVAGALAPLAAARVLACARLPEPRARGLLVTGGSGAGKTALCGALLRAARAAGLAGAHAIRAADVLSPRVGETEAALARAFTAARRAAPSLLFIDGLDALVPARAADDAADAREGSWARRLLATLLAELDGAASGGVALVATAATAAGVDAALRRPGRLDAHVALGPPTDAERAAMLDGARARARAPAARDDAAWPARRARLVAATAGASRAAVTDAWRCAAMCALRRLAGGAGAGAGAETLVDVDDDDITRALSTL
jgi:SpoVK/Ycf46/Vps4 family AAA+-type ATPase